jgi:hypothetical protein
MEAHALPAKLEAHALPAKLEKWKHMLSLQI